jgi:hypothetical protein
MNKKQVIRVISFILIVLFLLVHLTYTIRTNGDVKDRFVGFYWEKNNTIDAVMIGSSPVPMGFSTPMIYGDTGITVYPMSSNMQRPIATKYLVEEALKSQSPDMFIFEMRMWTAADEDLLGNMAHTREVTDNMKYSVNRIKAINALVSDPEERLTYYFDIFKYHSNWKTLALTSQLRTAFYAYPEDLKGSLAESDVGPSDGPTGLGITDKEPMPAEQEACLRDLLQYLKDNNIKALFVVSPYAVKEHEQRRFNYMADIIAEYGYDFVDMNQHLDEIGLNFATDIRDYGTHANVLGQQKITAWFEDYLVTNYRDAGISFAEDHRGDKTYKSWDEAYELWLTESAQAAETCRSNIKNGIFYQLEE